MKRKFYVYVYLDPRKRGRFCYRNITFLYEPFYIGKGQGNRYLEHLKHLEKHTNNHFKGKLLKILKSGFININLQNYILIFRNNLLEEEAFELERELIEQIGRRSANAGPLTNLAAGGNGPGAYRRKDFASIQSEFEKRKYNLLAEQKDYKGCRTKLKYMCPKGHKGSIAWGNFQQGYGCPVCARDQRKLDFSTVKKEFEKRGYRLLAEQRDYKNGRTKLQYICSAGHLSCVSWNRLRRGAGCVACFRKRKRVDFCKIKEEFERRRYELLTRKPDYENQKTKLHYICPAGHKGATTWNNFYHGGSGCPICAGNQKKNFSVIRQVFEARGYKLLTAEKDYVNAHQKLTYMDTEDCKRTISWDRFQRKLGKR